MSLVIVIAASRVSHGSLRNLTGSGRTRHRTRGLLIHGLDCARYRSPDQCLEEAEVCLTMRNTEANLVGALAQVNARAGHGFDIG
jgi:hypothetical protein